MAQTFDPERFKRDERQRWEEAAAVWRRMWPMLERGAQPVSDRLIELAELRAGDIVLDVATGGGEPALTAARPVAPTGRVIGIDHSDAMLAFARDRARELGIANVEFRQGDAESIDFPRGYFDVVLSRWGLMFLPNLDATLRRLFGVLRPGGRFATAVWSSIDKMPMWNVAGAAIRSVVELPPPDPSIPGPSSLADTDAFGRKLEAAGFRAIRVEPLMVRFEFPSAHDYARITSAMGFRQVIAAQTAEIQQKILNALSDAARAHTADGGVVRFDNQAMLVAART